MPYQYFKISRSFSKLNILCVIPHFSLHFIFVYFFSSPNKMARTAMTSSMKKGKGKGKKVSSPKTPEKKSTPKKERRSFSVRKPNITQSQPIKRKSKKANTMVLKEIKFYQKSTNFLISKSPFTRMVRDIASTLAKNTNADVPRFTAQSLEVLQEVFEAHLTTLMEASYLASRHAKRVTLYPSDIKLINKVKGGQNL